VADWNTIADYVRANWKISDDHGDRLGLLFGVGDERSQVIVLTRGGNQQGEEWIHFTSPIGTVGNVDVEKAALRANGYLCGGIVIDGGHVVARHSAPLENIDTNELERPMQVLLEMADSIEKDLTGGDEY
jgi:hypothetical protein